MRKLFQFLKKLIIQRERMGRTEAGLYLSAIHSIYTDILPQCEVLNADINLKKRIMLALHNGAIRYPTG